MSTVWLVVRRELTEKVRSRAFWIMNAILVAILVAAAVLPVVFGDDGTPDERTIAVVGDDAVAVAVLAAERAAQGGDLRLSTTAVADRAAAEAAVVEGEADLALVGTGEVLAEDQPGGRVVELLDGARRLVVLDAALDDAGVDQQRRAELLSPPPLARTALVGPEDDTDPDPVALAAGLTAVGLLYGLLIFYGQQVAQGIVQEKQSRVIEVLLATLRPIQLLGGKLLGLGLLGLLQVAGLGVAGYLALVLSGRDAIPDVAVPTVLAAIGWFVLGYALYATLFALSAAVVAKIEDLQTAMTVPILLLIGSFFLVQFSITDPDGTISTVAAYLPTSAPIAQPLRVALGTAGIGSTLLGIASTVAATALLVPLTARVHAGAALSTRQRISIGDALRRNRE